MQVRASYVQAKKNNLNVIYIVIVKMMYKAINSFTNEECYMRLQAKKRTKENKSYLVSSLIEYLESYWLHNEKVHLLPDTQTTVGIPTIDHCTIILR